MTKVRWTETAAADLASIRDYVGRDAPHNMTPMAPAKRAKSDRQYAFKVWLKRRRSIWRTIVLRGDQTLDDLHAAIGTAYERDDDHLYAFYMPKAPARRARSESRAKEYVSPIGYQFDRLLAHRRFDASVVTLDELPFKASQSFEYLFDFGDEWWHEITVEAIGTSSRAQSYPQFGKRKGASPAQYAEEE